MHVSVYEPIFKKMDRGEVPSLLRAQSLFCNMGMVTLLSLQCCWGFSEVGYVSVLTLWVFTVTAEYYIIQHHILYIILYDITYYTSYYMTSHIIHHIIRHHILYIILYDITYYTSYYTTSHIILLIPSKTRTPTTSESK